MNEWINPTNRDGQGGKNNAGLVKDAAEEAAFTAIARVFVLRMLSNVESDPGLDDVIQQIAGELRAGGSIRDYILDRTLGRALDAERLARIETNMALIAESDSPAAVFSDTARRIVSVTNNLSDRVGRMEETLSQILGLMRGLAPIASPPPPPPAIESPSSATKTSRPRRPRGGEPVQDPLTLTTTLTGAAALAGDDYRGDGLAPAAGSPDRARPGPKGGKPQRTGPIDESPTAQVVKHLHTLVLKKGQVATLSDIRNHLATVGFSLKGRDKSFLNVVLGNHCCRFGVNGWWPSTIPYPEQAIDYRSVTLPANWSCLEGARKHLAAHNKQRKKLGRAPIEEVLRKKTRQYLDGKSDTPLLV